MKQEHKFWNDQIVTSQDDYDDFTQHFVETLSENAKVKSDYIKEDDYQKLDRLLKKALEQQYKETIVDKLCRLVVYVLDFFTAVEKKEANFKEIKKTVN